MEKIELRKNRVGEFFFRKISKNGKQIGKASESYKTRRGALNGLKSDTVITLRCLGSSPLHFVGGIQYTDRTKELPARKWLKLI